MGIETSLQRAQYETSMLIHNVCVIYVITQSNHELSWFKSQRMSCRKIRNTTIPALLFADRKWHCVDFLICWVQFVEVLFTTVSLSTSLSMIPKTKIHIHNCRVYMTNSPTKYRRVESHSLHRHSDTAILHAQTLEHDHTADSRPYYNL